MTCSNTGVRKATHAISDPLSQQRAALTKVSSSPIGRTAGVEPRPNHLDRVEQTLQAVQGIEMGLHRPDHVRAGGQGVEHEQPKRRGAIDQADVVPVGDRPQLLAQNQLLAGSGSKFQVEPRQKHVGRQQVEVVDVGPLDDRCQAGVAADHEIVHRQVQLVRIVPQAEGGVSLRVEILQQTL